MKCFVIMPFAKSFDDVYDAIRQSVDNAIVDEKVVCRRLDEIKSAGRITDDLIHEINEAIICIADVTGSNANVMWEVGYAMALGKPILFISQNVADLPFDLKDMRTIPYERNSLKATLRTPLVEAFLDTIARQKARTDARRLPVQPRPGLTIAVTGSQDAEETKTRRRLEALLSPYLSSDTNWMVGSWGMVDELAAEYLGEHSQSVIVVSSRSYHVSQRSLQLVEKFKLLFLEAEQEQIPKGLKAPSNREALFLTKADLIVLLWDGNSPGIKRFLSFYTEQGKDFILGWV